MADSTVKVNFIGDSSRLKKAVDDAEGHLGRLGHGIADIAKKAAIGFAAVGAGAAVFAKSAIGAASDLAESQGKVNVVFKEQAKEITAWASTASKAFGQSKQSALEAVGTFGNLFKAFGIGDKQTATMSKSLVELAADLASFNNTSVDDALLALRSGLSGETEPLKRYGIALSDARLKTEALSLGLIKSTKDALTPAAKAQASYSLILKDSALAQGDFARTSDGLANKQRILKAQFSDIQAEIGTKLLPVALALAGALSDKVIPAIERIGSDPRFKKFISDVGDAAKDVFGWIQENVPPVLDAIGNFIQTKVVPALQELAHWVRDELGPALGKMAASFREEIWPVLEEKVLPALGKLAQFIKDEVLPILGKIVVFIVAELIPAFFKVVNWIATVLIPKIAEITVAFWHFVIDVKDVVMDVVDAFKDVGEKIWAPFKWAFDKITAAWDNSIGWIIKELKDFKPIGFGSSGNIEEVKALAAQGRAGGGPVTGGRPYIVGERGPELFVPSLSGSIVPNSRMGGGGATVNVTVQGNVWGADLERIVAKAVVDASNNTGGLPIRIRAAS